MPHDWPIQDRLKLMTSSEVNEFAWARNSIRAPENCQGIFKATQRYVKTLSRQFRALAAISKLSNMFWGHLTGTNYA